MNYVSMGSFNYVIRVCVHLSLKQKEEKGRKDNAKRNLSRASSLSIHTDHYIWTITISSSCVKIEIGL